MNLMPDSIKIRNKKVVEEEELRWISVHTDISEMQVVKYTIPSSW